MPEYADGLRAVHGNNFAVPALILDIFPDWFVGFAFAAIGIGALVPAAIMSIAAANLFTRNIYREFINPNCTPARGSADGEVVSLVVKVGALLFIIVLPTGIRHPAAAPRRHLDHPDPAGGDPRALHALVRRMGAADRLGGRASPSAPGWRVAANFTAIYPLTHPRLDAARLFGDLHGDLEPGGHHGAHSIVPRDPQGRAARRDRGGGLSGIIRRTRQAGWRVSAAPGWATGRRRCTGCRSASPERGSCSPECCSS